jgi:hypothetical protein
LLDQSRGIAKEIGWRQCRSRTRLVIRREASDLSRVSLPTEPDFRSSVRQFWPEIGFDPHPGGARRGCYATRWIEFADAAGYGVG